jgi:hypothetical protein
MEPLRDLAGRLQALNGTVSRSAQLGDDRQLALAAEHLLRLHVEFARRSARFGLTGKPPTQLGRRERVLAVIVGEGLGGAVGVRLPG